MKLLAMKRPRRGESVPCSTSETDCRANSVFPVALPAHGYQSSVRAAGLLPCFPVRSVCSPLVTLPRISTCKGPRTEVLVPIGCRLRRTVRRRSWRSFPATTPIRGPSSVRWPMQTGRAYRMPWLSLAFSHRYRRLPVARGGVVASLPLLADTHGVATSGTNTSISRQGRYSRGSKRSRGGDL